MFNDPILLRIFLILLFCIVLLIISFFSYRRYKKVKKDYLTAKFNNITDRLRILNRINELIIFSTNMTDVLNVIVDEVPKIIKNVRVIIFLLSDNFSELKTVVSSSNCKDLIKKININRLNQPKIMDAILKKECMYLSNTNEVNPALKTGMIIPLLRKSEPTGAVMIADTDVTKQFTEEEQNYLRTFASQVSVIMENKRFLEMEKLYKDEIMGLNSITEVGLLSLTSDEVLEVLINRLVSISKASGGAIFIINPKNLELELGAKCGANYEKEAQLLAEDKNLAEETIKINKTVVKDNKISLPIKVSNAVYGCIILFKEELTERVINFLYNLAEKASLIIERTRVFESTMVIVNDLSAISYMGNVILSSVNIEEVLNLIVRSMSEMVEAKGTILRLLNESTQELEIYASYGLSSNFLSMDNRKVISTTEDDILKTHQILALEDIQNSSYEYKDKAKLEGIKALICVPLITKNKVIGTITVFFAHRKIFTENDKKLLLIFTSYTAIAIENSRLFKNWKNMYLNVIKSFATALDAKDNYTKGHSDEVTTYAVEIAKEMNLSENDMELLRYSAVLHDIGKIGIDDNILKKKSKLTVEEYETIKKHPALAAKIIETIDEFKEVAKIITHHHEHYDGGGYPDGLQSDSIPLLSRIISVVDAFEAMTSDRPYRKAMDESEALTELEVNKNKQFDPVVVDVFKKVLYKLGIL